jgi:hypothetical protein
MCLETFNLRVMAERVCLSAQNILHETQRAPRHVSSGTAASVQRWRGSCGQSDSHPQCDGEVFLSCEQELHTQGFLGVPTEDSNLAGVEAMQWVPLYLSIGHDRCYSEYLDFPVALADHIR